MKKQNSKKNKKTKKLQNNLRKKNLVARIKTKFKNTKKQNKKDKKFVKQGISVEQIRPNIEVDVKVEIKKPSLEKMYFTTETEDAIVQYNCEQDYSIKNEIYELKIRKPFEKLVENVFNTFKFTYFGVCPINTQQETISHLVANMHKYEKGKGKAFSYFSIIAKNYLIFHNNLNFKTYNSHVQIGEDQEEGNVVLQCTDGHHVDVQNKEFLKLMVDYWDKNLHNIFKKQKDLSIAKAVIELFRNNEKIDSFNKKALYLYIREISSCHTQQITKVINKMKVYQQQIRKSYIENGVV